MIALTLAILAGGKSQRMGTDKAIVLFRGESLIRRVINRLASLAAEVIVIAPGSENYLVEGISIIPDLLPGHGSLGGLYTALSAASHPFVAAVGCDMPFVSADLITHQRDILVSEKADIVVPSSEKGLEPLHAVYRKDTCLPVVKNALDIGEQRMISWFPRVRLRVLTLKEIYPFDPGGLIFINVNTPGELARAEKLASGEVGT